MAILAVIAPARLRLTRRELPYLLAFGFVGLAFVQWFYFLAIHRLAIGVALLIEYLAPLLVALWAQVRLQGSGAPADLGRARARADAG